MSTVFQQLKEAREGKEMSLEDITAVTNISPELLKEIDAGRTDILPQAYVRAFLREYATAVGLDPGKIMSEYDSTRKEKRQDTQPQHKANPETRPIPLPRDDTHTDSTPGPATIAAVVAVIALAAVLYWNFFGSSGNQVSEQPSLPEFDPPSSPLQSPVQDPPAQPATSPDSLTLQAKTSDSVWVLLIVDTNDSLEYILPPESLRTWKAASSFRISLGRPEAIEFSLNGTPMGKLGNRRQIVRDSLIDRSTLSLLGKPE